MSLHVAARPTKATFIEPTKAISGPGASGWLYQTSLSTIGNTPQKMMRQAYDYWRSNMWVRAAERVISARFSTVDWHLEDDDDNELDEETGSPLAQNALQLLEKPYENVDNSDKLTRRMLWSMTCRDMGICGSAFWFLDQLDADGLPASTLYIAPWRMTPSTDKQNNLIGWILDAQGDQWSGYRGTPLDLDEVLHFPLEPDSIGWFPPGLVESALSKIQLAKGTDTHIINTLASGARLAGIVSPKTDSIPADAFEQMVRDLRNIAEHPDAAKRMSVLAAPIDFARTAATPAELNLIEFANMTRDDILALWGCPLSQLGISTATGLNSGEATKYEEASLWQNAVGPRLIGFREKLQFGLLDRFKDAGQVVELEIDQPEFDDDGPRYELVQRSLTLPMRNYERRALVGLDPTGDDVFDNEVWLPVTQVIAATVGSTPDALVPPDNTTPIYLLGSQQAQLDQAGVQTPAPSTAQVPMTPAPPIPAAAQAAVAGKASLSPLHQSLVRFRARVEKGVTPQLKSATAEFLAAQKADIVAKIKRNWEHIKAKRVDTDVWWAGAKWDRQLTAALSPHLTGMAETLDTHIAKALGKDEPAEKASAPKRAVDSVLRHHAARVSGINETTRQAIDAAINQAIIDGLTAQAAADVIEGLTAFDDARSEMIARTELMDSYNAAALGSYTDAGIEQVQAIDGDGDPECAERDGQVYDVDEADSIEDHPNGTLDWVPIVEFGKATLPAKEAETHIHIHNEIQPQVVNVAPANAAIEVYPANPEAPHIHVEPTPVNVQVAAPNVEVHHEPVINVAASPAPNVVVNMPEQAPVQKTMTVQRDQLGRIKSAEITEEQP